MPDVQQDAAPQPSPAIADLAGPDDKSMAGLVSSLTDLQRKKVAADTRISNESDDQQNRDRAVRNHAFQMEGVAASELPKPWDAEKEHKKWETNPIEGFGSAGGLFAMVASAFTKAPMENAINGLAGAINSIKEGKEAGYARAYDAFKTNVKLADQRFKNQHELYTDALALGSADAAASAAKLHNAAVRFGDSQILMLAEHGMIKEIYELQEARAKSHEEMMKAADATDLHSVQKAAVDAVKMNPPQTGDPVQDKMQLAAQIQRIYDGNGKYGTAEQEAVGKYVQANINKPAQEFATGLADIHQQFSVKAPNIQGYQEARQAKMDANNGAITPEDDSALLQQFGLTPKGAGSSASPGAKLDEKTINELSDQYIAGDTSVFTNLGRGKQGGENVIAVRAKIAEKLAEQGKTGKDQALKNAEYGGTKAALRTAATREATIGQAAFEAKKFMTIAKEASDAVPRSNLVPFNKAVQMVEAATGDPALKRFVVANNSLVNQYVRAISPTGVPTDIVRKHAYDMLATADGPKAYDAVLDIMNNEMDAAITSPAKMRDYIMGTGAAPTESPEGVKAGPKPYEGTVIKYDKDGNRIK